MFEDYLINIDVQLETVTNIILVLQYSSRFVTILNNFPPKTTVYLNMVFKLF